MKLKTSKDVLQLCQFFYDEYQLTDSENFKDHHKFFVHAKICPFLYDSITLESKHPQKDVVLIFEIEKKLDENSKYIKNKHLNEKSIPKWLKRKQNSG
jgi:3-phenylpropionate/cinnamic acid dioxygenase small subunit